MGGACETIKLSVGCRCVSYARSRADLPDPSSDVAGVAGFNALTKFDVASRSVSVRFVITVPGRCQLISVYTRLTDSVLASTAGLTTHRSRSITFISTCRSHGFVLYGNGICEAQLRRSRTVEGRPSVGELTGDRGPVSAFAFLLQVCSDGHQAIHEENGRNLDARGMRRLSFYTPPLCSALWPL